MRCNLLWRCTLAEDERSQQQVWGKDEECGCDAIVGIKLAAGRDSVMMGDAVTQLLAASANFL